MREIGFDDATDDRASVDRRYCSVSNTPIPSGEAELPGFLRLSLETAVRA